jgi:hypothetical protein
MCPDPYKDKSFDYGMPAKLKTPVIGKIICVLHARSDSRALELCPYPSRAVLKNEVHELILTDEIQAGPKNTVNKISYLAFIEILESGILWSTDRVEINGKPVGILAGYDFTHMPNHMNIVLKTTDELYTGYEAGLKPGDMITFSLAKSPDD